MRDNSVDGFIVDLPRENDERVDLSAGERAGRSSCTAASGAATSYGWVDMDNYGNFYRLARLLIANGHRRIAFINGDEHFNYALYRHHAVRDAVADAGLPAERVTVYNSAHPMGDAGFRLTQRGARRPPGHGGDLFVDPAADGGLRAAEPRRATRKGGRSPSRPWTTSCATSIRRGSRRA